MRFGRFYIIIIFTFICFSGVAQNNFRIIDTRKESVTVPFTLVNNLVVIKATVNGKELSFLLDTGIVKTILFNLKYSDSLQLNSVNKIKLRGLGDGVPINALKSDHNHVQIGGVANFNHLIYLITDNMFNLSAKMGIDINGIIGGDLFKDLIIKINYTSKKVTFYNPETYVYKICSKCETFPLDFFNHKPFIKIKVENHLGEEHLVNLLIDSGGGDALWLFENTNPNIIVPNKYFDDYLGKGLNGDIYGKRSKINKISIGSFVFNNASVSYPDSVSILTATQNNKSRNGTLGANILKRFHVIFDYPNSKITLKKNLKYFKEPFRYNKSGVEIIYGKEILVKDLRPKITNKNKYQNNGKDITDLLYSYNLSYKPSYEISHIREGSPAKIIGLLVGDIILEINGATAYDKEMKDIILILSGRDEKKIKLLISRNGKHLKYEFYLKDLL